MDGRGVSVRGAGSCLQEVAQFTAECEKFVGTESGGMDQAISIMGELGLAKLVHFNPVSLSLDNFKTVTCRRQFIQHLFEATSGTCGLL